MKLPFLILPRTVYEDLRGDLEAALKREAALHQLLLDMKLDGAQVIRHNPDFRRAQREKEVDPIDEALEENPKYRMNPVLKRRMRLWADEQLADPRKSRDVVLDRIRNWDRVNPSSVDEQDDEDANLGLIRRA